MADLPSNLDDGELWLPSDVICAVGICRHHHPTDDLTQKLASFALFDGYHAIPAVSPFRDSPFYPDYEQGRLVSWLSPTNLGYKAPLGRRVAAKTATCGGGGGGGGGRTDHILPFPPVIHKFNRGVPLDSCVDDFRLERARVLQRHRQQQGYALNRFVPVRASGFGRECGGTGVFLPRVLCEDAKTKPLSPWIYGRRAIDDQILDDSWDFCGAIQFLPEGGAASPTPGGKEMPQHNARR